MITKTNDWMIVETIKQTNGEAIWLEARYFELQRTKRVYLHGNCKEMQAMKKLKGGINQNGM